MAHPQQQQFCEAIKARFPQYFTGTMTLDIGSLDINGNNQYLFDTDCLYLGIDVACGRNVDVISPAHELGLPAATFDTIVTTECLEHDRHWVDTLRNAVRMLRPGGMLLLTCATTGRPEHGTRRTTPHDAPLLASVDDEWADYYRNLDENDLRSAVDMAATFQLVEFSIGEETHDLYFVAIKHGAFERRVDRSTQLPSQPRQMLQAQLLGQAHAASEARQRAETDLSCTLQCLAREQATVVHLLQRLDALSLDEQVRLAQETAERDALTQQLDERQAQAELAESALSLQREKIVQLEQELTAVRLNMEQAQTRQSYASNELSQVYGSKSWRVTHPLRVVMTQVGKVRKVARRARNGLRYVARGDFSGLRNRVRSIQSDQTFQNLAVAGPPQRWAIMGPPHTLFVAHLIASRLRVRGWEAEVLTEAPREFAHDMYVVICPQIFEHLPPGEKRIVYQMEQSVSSRWFTDAYFATLQNSLAVLEYALVNMEFLVGKGVAYPHVHYLPVGADANYMRHLPSVEKSHEVLFYGDPNSSPRRRDMLATLQRHFDVRVCSEVFALEMIEELRRARVVINLHYYENALLEMPRVQECLSLGIPVVSESAQDSGDYPEIAGAITFFEQGNEAAMVDAVRAALTRTASAQEVQLAAERGSERFAFMFDRFLVAMNFLPASKLADDGLPLPHDATRIALSMPETIARRRIFEANRPENCAVFDGVRIRPGWVGCGLSYASLARHALKHGIKRLTVVEDDVLLPLDFEEKMRTVHTYLDMKQGRWDIFSGVIATLHEDACVSHLETFNGMQFVTIDKMTSTVCNIYSEKAQRMLAAWDPENRDDQSNTIDRYLERQAKLRIVVALPFLVGHREEVYSTLWGFQNVQYCEMIAESERNLQALVARYVAAAPAAVAIS